MRKLLPIILLLTVLTGCSRPAAPPPAPPPASPPPAATPAAPPAPPQDLPPQTFSYQIESAPDRSGPWTPSPPGAFLPVGHQWLRFRFPYPMTRDSRAEWADDRTAILPVDPASSVIDVHGWRDAAGREAYHPVRYLFRGELPVLQRIGRDGNAVPVAALEGAPERLSLDLERNRVRYQSPPRSYWIDLQTGALTNDGSIMSGGHGYGEIIFAAPGGGRVAEVLEPGTLVIRENGQERLRLPDWLPVDRSAIGDCAYGDPAGAWRPDGGLLAVTALPAPGAAELWLLDPATQVRQTLATLRGLKRAPAVTWSPDGRYITFGPQVLDAASGATVGVPAHPTLLWSPDGTRYLTSSPLSGKWGPLLLVEPASERVQDLGYGWPLGFTPAGDAVVATWPASRDIPPDPCRW